MRHRPDPRQGLFRWVWHDPADERPDDLNDEPAPGSAPLGDRVRQRHGLRTLALWGVPITLAIANAARPDGRPFCTMRRPGTDGRPRRVRGKTEKS